MSKTRQGFVSNSSSSSFILIEKSQGPLDYPSEINLMQGEYEFGWQEQEYSDVESKLNWSLIMANDEQVQWIKTVIQDETGIKLKGAGWIHENGYIDHQSRDSENSTMLDSEEKLLDFVFNPYSYIKNDNDNH